MDFSLTREQECFCGEVRAWLSKQMRQEWVARLSKGSDIPRPEAYELLRRWQGQLHEAGFVGLTWPKEAGGRGRTVMEEVNLQQDKAPSKAPPGRNNRANVIPATRPPPSPAPATETRVAPHTD